MGILFKDIKVGDEFYRIRQGKQLKYEKCEVIKINKPDIIVYKIKGRSKDKTYWIRNRNIIAYSYKFFRKKDNFLLYIHRILIPPTFFSKEEIYPQVLQELEKFKKNKPQYFI